MKLRNNWISTLRVCLIAVLACWPGFAAAAIIGQGNTWKPLRSGAHALGISEEMVERILAAGVEMSCPGTVHRNGGVLNGWFLGGDETSFYTNAHGVIDIGADQQANFIEPLDKCNVRSYGDLLKRGAKAASYALDLPTNRNDMSIASFTPQRDSPSQDRARLTLLRAIAGARPLALPDLTHLSFTDGEQVLMVSLLPPAMQEPVIQACHIKDIDLHDLGPGQLFTDCDNSFGNSAALYFVRDPTNPSMLLPIAMHEGCHEKLGDHKAWSEEDNTALGIMLRRGFFSFPRHTAAG
jgi:hypothetical protein